MSMPTEPVAFDDSSTPTFVSKATPTVLHSILKKVTFSTPEVTEQRQFEIDSVSGGCGPDDNVVHVTKARKVKKRHRHHREDQEEGATIKRRRVREGNEELSAGQPRSAGMNPEAFLSNCLVRM
jgi:hypothetical protein